MVHLLTARAHDAGGFLPNDRTSQHLARPAGGLPLAGPRSGQVEKRRNSAASRAQPCWQGACFVIRSTQPSTHPETKHAYQASGAPLAAIVLATMAGGIAGCGKKSKHHGDSKPQPAANEPLPAPPRELVVKDAEAWSLDTIRDAKIPAASAMAQGAYRNCGEYEAAFMDHAKPGCCPTATSCLSSLPPPVSGASMPGCRSARR
jgi:hypothetical protein